MSVLTTPLKIWKTKGSFVPPTDTSGEDIAVLQSALSDSIYIEWEVNNTYQAQFTAYDDGSEAYNLLTVQNMVKIDDQWFVIKQIEDDYANGLATKQVQCTHVSNEIARWRHYNVPIDWGSGASTQVSSDSNDQAVTVTPKDLLDIVATGGITYEIHGNFSSASIAPDFSTGSYKDIVDKIKDTWTDAIVMPDNLKLNVYTRDAFYHNTGNRIDYLHDSSEVQLTYDSTDMQNAARLVGATYTQESTTDTGLPNGQAGKGAQAVINDAKKYLGVPYRWGGAGGARGGDPYTGMDCSSFVSQVYKDFGINIPAYTVSMEAYGHEVSSPQTGDMGFYGSHGASHHICMALDSNTMIYEPEPGEVCKMTPISYYPPTWWERNDQMAAIVASSGEDGTDASTTESSENYYFAPFYYVNQESNERWGTFVGDDITSETIQNKDQMKQYADAQFKLNPDLSVQVTLDNNRKPDPGDMVRIEIKPKQYVTTIGVVGFQWYPYSETTQTTVTLNSNLKNALDYDHAQNQTVADIQRHMQTVFNNYDSNKQSDLESWTEKEVKDFGNNDNG